MIAITGNGHLGNYLKSKPLWPETTILLTARIGEIIAGDLEGVDVLINTAGKTDLAWCEANKAEAFDSNVTQVASLYRACLEAGARLIHLSSGCVWDGPYQADGQPFEPDSPTSPACFYAETKVACDQGLMSVSCGKDLAILRLRMPYSPVVSDRNLLSKLSKYQSLIDEQNSITSADTLARTIESLLGNDLSPLWHRISLVYDRGHTTPFLIGQMLHKAGLREYPKKLEKVSLDSWHKPKRVNTVMRDHLFEQTIDAPRVEVELERVTALYKENYEHRPA